MSIIGRQYANFQYVPFVSASQEGEENCTKLAPQPESNLSGEEASLFYKEIISAPSTASNIPTNSINVPKKKLKTSNVSKYENSRLTIFHYAQNGNIEGIKYLISKGCDIDMTDIFGWTALMCAAAQGHYSVVEFLIKKGAKKCIKNKQDQTALDVAIKKNHVSLIKLLSDSVQETVFAQSTVATKEELNFCNLCKCSFKESSTAHQSSIAHLLVCTKSNSFTFYHIPENNKGFQIMLKKGWDKNKGLGADSKGRKFPIKTALKKDRSCLGGKKEVSKITHFSPNDDSAVKKHNQPGIKIVRERTYKKWELQKLQRIHRQKEMDFRRQFNLE